MKNLWWLLLSNFLVLYPSYSDIYTTATDVWNLKDSYVNKLPDLWITNTSKILHFVFQLGFQQKLIGRGKSTCRDLEYLDILTRVL